ncbi:MAG: molybdenum cofactor guanylyltransferase [Planctomycetota bacterium]|nr:MAG: molybdenum cofactor guanylyltransferase [Planctomycetota bacterium]
MTPLPFAAILAGGRARRMGRPKHALQLGGTSLLERLARRLRAHACELVVVGEGLEEAARPLGLRVVADPVPGRPGPLGGLLAALEAAPPGEAFVWAVDMPLVAPRALALLVAMARCAPEAAAVLFADANERLQPLAGLYRPERCRTSLRRAFERGQRSVLRALRALPLVTVGAATLAGIDPPLDTLAGCNTPEQFRALAQRLRRRR